MQALRWRTKDGRVIPINEMSDEHLLNCIKMLLRDVHTRRAFFLMNMVKLYIERQDQAELARLEAEFWAEELAYGADNP